MKGSRLRNRDRYLEEAMFFRDTDLIKVITGVRRCGKSSLLDLIRMTIESEGVAGRGFVSVNLESKGTGIKTEDQLYDYVRGRLSDKGRTYVFIDEPQRIDGWQDAVNAMRVDFDCDIYLTGHLSLRALRRGKDAASVLLRVRRLLRNRVRIGNFGGSHSRGGSRSLRRHAYSLP